MLKHPSRAQHEYGCSPADFHDPRITNPMWAQDRARIEGKLLLDTWEGFRAALADLAGSGFTMKLDDVPESVRARVVKYVREFHPRGAQGLVGPGWYS
jgi:hypothetical protein